MKLKYVGPKAIISPLGVSFKTGKEDKYIYINHCMQIYKAISHDYKKEIIYHYDIEDVQHEDKITCDTILELKPSLKDLWAKETREIDSFLDQEIENLSNKNLNEEELKVYRNNLIIMKPYRKQRRTNKLFYEHLIEIIVDKILENKIKEVNTPFNEKFWHILQSIQAKLSNYNKKSISSSLRTYDKEEDLTITLQINTIF